MQNELQLGELAAELQACFDMLQTPKHGTIMAALAELLQEEAIYAAFAFQGGRQQVLVTGAKLRTKPDAPHAGPPGPPFGVLP